MGPNPEDEILQEGARLVAQIAIEFEVEARICAECHERSPQWETDRNGHRERMWEMRMAIPELGERRCFPSLPQPRIRAEKAFLAVMQMAY